MSFRSRFLSVVTISLALAVSAMVVSAQETSVKKDDHINHDRGGKRMHGAKGKRARMGEFRGLDLTEAQKGQIRLIRESMRTDQATHQEMRTLQQAKRSGTMTVEQKNRMETLRAQAMERQELVRIQVEGILTPEQKKVLETRRAERQKRMEDRKKVREALRSGTKNK